jgi:predicted HicB family RNase H-like nuclease
MGILSYKGYSGSAEYSPEDEVFHGKLLQCHDSLPSYPASPTLNQKDGFCVPSL